MCICVCGDVSQASLVICISFSVYPCVCVCVFGSPGVCHPCGPRVPSPCALCCRTATVWRSLSPFWGEEYTIHLPLDFHHLAFYVLDEDTVGCVCWGPRPGYRREGGPPRSNVPTRQPSMPGPAT